MAYMNPLIDQDINIDAVYCSITLCFRDKEISMRNVNFYFNNTTRNSQFLYLSRRNEFY